MRREFTLLLVVVVLAVYWIASAVVVADNVTDRVTITTAPNATAVIYEGEP